jgi:hypothetical protein
MCMETKTKFVLVACLTLLLIKGEMTDFCCKVSPIVFHIMRDANVVICTLTIES